MPAASRVAVEGEWGDDRARKLVQRFDELELLEAKRTWGRSLFRVPGRIPVSFNVR